jgi:hypothetical protein
MSYSQFGQDLWVLEYFNQGVFVDVGFNDGINISNTKLLEDRGWSGLGIDPFPRNFKSRTKTSLEIGCVYGEDKQIEFICASDLGGIKEHIDAHKDHSKVKSAHTVKIQAKTLEYFLQKHHMSPRIEYLSIDTEGSEYEILASFPFEKYLFGCITCEHNNESKKREKIQELLKNKDYLLDRELGVDDCFVHKSVKNNTFYIKK